MVRTVLPLLLGALLVAGCGDGDEKGSSSPRPATLVLDFTPNAAHAGIYAAVAKHRDRDHGVKLAIRQPTASSDSLKLLSVGRADLAVADIHDLGLARERGEDLVGVGALVQRPLASVIAGPKVTRPRQLEGKRVGVTGVPSDNAVLRAVVNGDGGGPRGGDGRGRGSEPGAHDHDRLHRGAEPDRGQGRGRHGVLERRGRGAEAPR